MSQSKLTEEKSAKPWRPWLICVLLLAIVFLVFLPARNFEFINYDDPDYVTANTHVQQGLTSESVQWAFQSGEYSNWHPLTWLSHMLDWQMFGEKPGGHHLTSVMFHAANTLLLFLLLLKMTGALWRSAFVAALFGLHPLHVESVAWVSERKDVLSAFFWILTTLAYVSYARRKSSTGNGHSTLFYLGALFFFACGLMAKPMVVTLPFTLLLLDFWPLQRVFSSQSSVSSSAPKAAEHWKLNTEHLPRLLLEKVPFFVLIIISGRLTFWAQKKGGAVTSLNALPIAARVTNALISYPRYLWKMLWPENLAVLYPHPWKTQAGLAVAATIFLLAVTAWAIWRIKKNPYLAFGWFWFLGTLIPVIGLVQVGLQSMADRYTYIPLIGIFILIAWGAYDWLSPRPGHQTFLGIAAAAILLSCTIATSIQLGSWQNSGTLFEHAVKATKKNFLAHNNLGYYLFSQHQTNAAIENYQKAIDSYADFDIAWNNMGYALAEQGRVHEAIPYYQRAMQLKPQSADVHNNLGNALGSAGQPKEALDQYFTALKLNPQHADAHNNLGVALAQQGQLAEGAKELKEGLRLKPKNASAHSNLGNIYAMQGKFDEAIEQYTEALAQKPDDAQAHNNLANVLSSKNRLDEAVSHYETALKLNDNNPEANCNLAFVLIKQGKLAEARTHLLEALRLRPNYPEAQQQLNSLGEAKP
jgi:tetratricopeptide (TPR) repeat protein